MDHLTLGLVGVGRIGQLHARTLADLTRDLAEVGTTLRLLLTDVALDHARTVAAEVGAEVAPSVDALLERGVDGLVVATGTATHPALVRAGVDAGVPVFCEKPVAADVPLSLEVLEHVRARGGQLVVGHQRRFDAGYLEAKRALAAGELGWLHSFRAVTCDVSPPPVTFLATSGGLFRDCSVHD